MMKSAVQGGTFGCDVYFLDNRTALRFIFPEIGVGMAKLLRPMHWGHTILAQVAFTVPHFGPWGWGFEPCPWRSCVPSVWSDRSLRLSGATTGKVADRRSGLGGGAPSLRGNVGLALHFNGFLLIHLHTQKFSVHRA